MMIVGVLRVFEIAMRMVTHVAKKGPTSNGGQARVEDRDVDEGKLWYDFSALGKTTNNRFHVGECWSRCEKLLAPHTRAHSSVHKSFAKYRPG